MAYRQKTPEPSWDILINLKQIVRILKWSKGKLEIVIIPISSRNILSYLRQWNIELLFGLRSRNSLWFLPLHTYCYTLFCYMIWFILGRRGVPWGINFLQLSLFNLSSQYIIFQTFSLGLLFSQAGKIQNVQKGLSWILLSLSKYTYGNL